MPRENLFVYGTLRFPSTQQKAFHSTKKGTPDSIKGFKRGKRWVVDDVYPVIIPSKNHSVKGMIIELTEKQLRLCDDYEGHGYFRSVIKTKKGTVAWVYRPVEGVIWN